MPTRRSGPQGDRDDDSRSDRAERSADGVMERMRAAAERDAAAEARDEAASTRDRLAAAQDGLLAAGDRERAAADREQSASDRRLARADREALLAELRLAETDPLTGARARRAGLADLDREIERAQRTTGLLSVAYVDVIGLKAVNDNDGHAAGDALLTRVVAVIREHLRSYDLIIRIGGDEFLCAMSNMPLAEARARFARVGAALTTTAAAPGIRTGFADITPGDSAPELMARADRALLEGRSR